LEPVNKAAANEPKLNAWQLLQQEYFTKHRSRIKKLKRIQKGLISSNMALEDFQAFNQT